MLMGQNSGPLATQVIQEMSLGLKVEPGPCDRNWAGDGLRGQEEEALLM